jgi:hypothetical protein
VFIRKWEELDKATPLREGSCKSYDVGAKDTNFMKTW